MKAVLVITTIVLGVSGVAGQQRPIDIHQARYYVGHRVTIEDAVTQVTREAQSGFTYLNFGGEFPRHVFRVVIPDAIYERLVPGTLGFPRIQVKGTPRLGLRGIPEIVCTDPSQITGLTAGRPVSPGTTAATPPSSPAPSAPPGLSEGVQR